jgi:hypothetical protein
MDEGSRPHRHHRRPRHPRRRITAAALKGAKRGESNAAINGALALASTEPPIVLDHVVCL